MLNQSDELRRTLYVPKMSHGDGDFDNSLHTSSDRGSSGKPEVAPLVNTAASTLHPESASKSKDRFKSLDGLRGVAAVLVVLFHIRWPNHITHNELIRNGYLAVDLFFILSGFVISANYSRKLKDFSRVREFIILRFFRVYPLHLTVLSLFVSIELLRFWGLRSGFAVPSSKPFSDGNSLGALFANALLIQGLGVFESLTWNIPSWSISCEFVAYLLFGIAALNSTLWSAALFATAAFLALSAYGVLAFTYQSLDLTYDWGLVRCVCGFVLGMAVFEVSRRNGARALAAANPTALAWAPMLVTAALIVVMSFTSGWVVVFVIPVFVIMVGVFQTEHGIVANMLNSRAAQYLGRISYSVYMIHFLVLTVFTMFLRRLLQVPMEMDPVVLLPVFRIDPWVGDLLVIAVVAAVVAISSVTHRVVEEPARLFGRELVISLRNRTSGAAQSEVAPTRSDPSSRR